jgi:hypothetical protein
VAKCLDQVCDKPCYSGSFALSILMLKQMVSSSKIDIEKINGKIFEL